MGSRDALLSALSYYMRVVEIILAIIVGVVLLVSAILLVRSFGGRRHELTRPELRNRAMRASERLAGLVEEQQAARPPADPVIKDNELPHRRVTAQDEEMQRVYRRDYLPEISGLREHFAGRRIRNDMLEELYESAENEADLRTISTALQEMAARLKT